MLRQAKQQRHVKARNNTSQQKNKQKVNKKAPLRRLHKRHHTDNLTATSTTTTVPKLLRPPGQPISPLKSAVPTIKSRLDDKFSLAERLQYNGRYVQYIDNVLRDSGADDPWSRTEGIFAHPALIFFMTNSKLKNNKYIYQIDNTGKHHKNPRLVGIRGLDGYQNITSDTLQSNSNNNNNNANVDVVREIHVVEPSNLELPTVASPQHITRVTQPLPEVVPGFGNHAVLGGNLIFKDQVSVHNQRVVLHNLPAAYPELKQRREYITGDDVDGGGVDNNSKYFILQKQLTALVSHDEKRPHTLREEYHGFFPSTNHPEIPFQQSIDNYNQKVKQWNAQQLEEYKDKEDKSGMLLKKEISIDNFMINKTIKQLAIVEQLALNDTQLDEIRAELQQNYQKLYNELILTTMPKEVQQEVYAQQLKEQAESNNNNDNDLSAFDISSSPTRPAVVNIPLIKQHGYLFSVIANVLKRQYTEQHLKADWAWKDQSIDSQLVKLFNIYTGTDNQHILAQEFEFEQQDDVVATTTTTNNGVDVEDGSNKDSNNNSNNGDIQTVDNNNNDNIASSQQQNQKQKKQKKMIVSPHFLAAYCLDYLGQVSKDTTPIKPSIFEMLEDQVVLTQKEIFKDDYHRFKTLKRQYIDKDGNFIGDDNINGLINNNNDDNNNNNNNKNTDETKESITLNAIINSNNNKLRNIGGYNKLDELDNTTTNDNNNENAGLTENNNNNTTIDGIDIKQLSLPKDVYKTLLRQRLTIQPWHTIYQQLTQFEYKQHRPLIIPSPLVFDDNNNTTNNNNNIPQPLVITDHNLRQKQQFKLNIFAKVITDHEHIRRQTYHTRLASKLSKFGEHQTIVNAIRDRIKAQANDPRNPIPADQNPLQKEIPILDPTSVVTLQDLVRHDELKVKIWVETEPLITTTITTAEHRPKVNLPHIDECENTEEELQDMLSTNPQRQQRWEEKRKLKLKEQQLQKEQELLGNNNNTNNKSSATTAITKPITLDQEYRLPTTIFEVTNNPQDVPDLDKDSEVEENDNNNTKSSSKNPDDSDYDSSEEENEKDSSNNKNEPVNQIVFKSTAAKLTYPTKQKNKDKPLQHHILHKEMEQYKQGTIVFEAIATFNTPNINLCGLDASKVEKMLVELQVGGL